MEKKTLSNIETINNVMTIECSTEEEALGTAILYFEKSEAFNYHSLIVTTILENNIPLQERFIRMYLKNKKLLNFFKIKENGGFQLISKGFPQEPICTLEDAKDFDSQSEEIYKQIFLALNDLGKIGQE